MSLPRLPSATVVSLSLRGLLPQVRAQVLRKLFIWANHAYNFNHQQRMQACRKAPLWSLQSSLNGLWDICGMTYLKVDLPRTFRGPIASAELPRVSAHTVPGKFLRLKRFIFPGLLIMKEVRKKPGSRRRKLRSANGAAGSASPLRLLALPDRKPKSNSVNSPTKNHALAVAIGSN